VLVVDCQATAAAPRGHLLEIGWAHVLGMTITNAQASLIALLGPIRFRGYLPKGGYDSFEQWARDSVRSLRVDVDWNSYEIGNLKVPSEEWGRQPRQCRQGGDNEKLVPAALRRAYDDWMINWIP
jgi:hypothetical protein